MNSELARQLLQNRLKGLSPERRAALEKLVGDNLDGARPARGRPPIVAAMPGEEMPLSFDQERIWYLYHLDPHQATLVLQVRLRTKVSSAALEATLRTLVSRHAILRTTYAMGADGVVQRIHDVGVIAVPCVNLRDLSKREAQDAFIALLNEQRYGIFDLEAGPIWRAVLVEHHAGRELCLTIHHIATDGWSINRLSAELDALSRAEAEGRELDLPALPFQYSDYAVWQRNWMQGAVLKERLRYWKECLADMPSALDLPTDHPRPAFLSGKGAGLSVVLPAELTAGLRRFAGGQQATLFMVLLALFKAFLYRYTGQTDIVIGTPVAGRDDPALEAVQGLFLNSLVLRTRFSADDNFMQLVERTRKTVLSAFEHRDLPFEKLVEALQPQRNLSRNPLYQALFSKPIIGEVKAYAGDRSELACGVTHLDEGQSEFDLALWAEEYDEALGLIFHYNPKLFEAPTIERMALHYVRLTEAVLDDPTRPLWRLPMLSEAEQHQLIETWNSTAIAFPDTPLTRLFEHQVHRAPERVVLEYGKTRLSYGELNASANQLANALRELGVGPGEMVAICIERSPQMLQSVLAVLKAGAAYVPLDPAFPAQRLEFMLKDSGAKVLVTRVAPGIPLLTAEGTYVFDIDREASAISFHSDGDLEQAPHAEDMAYMIYTSGSTGLPKGVLIRHGSLSNFLQSMACEPGLKHDDIFLAVTTISFDISCLELYLPLIVGARVALASREAAADGNALAVLLAESGATVMQATPATWRMLRDSGWSGDRRLKILCGGEALSKDLADHLLKRCAELWNLYGPTETTVWSTVSRVHADDESISVGHPIANTRVYLLDAHAQPVPIGVAGELYIGGAGVACGYWQRPELNDQRFVRDPFARNADARMYRTGDMARYRADGRIEFLGRADTQVKLRGYRLELGEIESTIARMPGVRQSIALVREDTPGDQRLVVYVVRESSEEPDTQAIRSHLGKALPSYMVPAACVFLDALPLTPNGKVDRKALPAVDWGDRTDTGYVAPRTANEIALALVWAEVLSVKKIGLHDNFFDLGGHSLLAMKAIVGFRERTGCKLDPRNFYQQTLGQLAATLEPMPATPLEADTIAMLRLDPFYFGSQERPLFGLQRHPVAPRGIGVVLCAPHAHEYVRCHRALRELAQRYARQGYHALSFDYFGTGDSGGRYEQVDPKDWADDVVMAIDALRERCGLSRVILVGLRLGATLAMSAAIRRSDVCAVVLWDPIISGTDYQLELEEIIYWQQLDASRLREIPRPDVLSFLLTPTAEKILREIDLAGQANLLLPPTLLLQTGDDTKGRAAQLCRSNAAIEYRRLEDANIWLREPYEAVVPHQVLNAILEWTVEMRP